MSIEAILQPILAKLSRIGKHQRTFLVELITVLLGRQGRATFENLGRYSRFTELTFRRQFATFFDWVGFNIACIDWQKETYIGIVDCSRFGGPIFAQKWQCHLWTRQVLEFLR